MCRSFLWSPRRLASPGEGYVKLSAWGVLAGMPVNQSTPHRRASHLLSTKGLSSFRPKALLNRGIRAAFVYTGAGVWLSGLEREFLTEHRTLPSDTPVPAPQGHRHL